MTDTGVVVGGAERLTRTLGALADDLGDLEPANRKAADQLLAEADPRTPYEGGELAGSAGVVADAVEGAVVYAAEYAGVVHNGWEARNITAQPWLTEAANPSSLTEVYVEHVTDLVHHVQGA